MRINKKTIIMIVMCAGILFMAVGYSLLQTELKITGGANITSTWDVRITSITNGNAAGTAYNLEEPSYTNNTAKFKVVLVNPGDSMTYTVTIKNLGTITAILNGINITTSGTDAIIYEVSGIQEGEMLAAGATKTLTVTARYDSNVIADPLDRVKTLKVGLNWGQYATFNAYTVKYNANGGEGSMMDTVCTIGSNCTLASNTFTKEGYDFTGWATSANGTVVYANNGTVTNLAGEHEVVTLYAVWYNPTLVNQILANNNAQPDTGINFGAISSDTNGKGLYYTSTNTENNGTTYYFRGAVTNNYVQFGKNASGNDLYWKIIRINEDGSIRLIYNGTSTSATGDDVTIGESQFNTKRDSNAYVGYMYGSTGASTYAATHANNNPSTIKTYIDNWYTNNTNLDSYRNTHLADAGFCNDRSVAPSAGLWNSGDTALGYAQNATYYGSYNRLDTNEAPQFACPNPSNDLFTTNSSTKGNKALTNPIGLITADELWYAGATTSNNPTHYLYAGSYYWTMSPGRFSGSNAHVWHVASDGYLGNLYVSNYTGVRPVVNLQSGVEITDGDGTPEKPYIIK